MQLNSHFISNIHDIYGLAGDSWIKELPNIIQQLAGKWDFHFLHPMPYLSYNFAGLVRLNKTNETAVIKMAPKEGSHITAEIQWLKCFEKCVPKIYEFDEAMNAFLMEHLTPGQTLKNLVVSGDDDGATKIICQIIRELHAKKHTSMPFKHLSELPYTLSLLKGQFDARLLSKAESLFHDLTCDRTGDDVLHGDLHHDNILSSHTGWKAIDPHGYVGDPAFEAGPMIYNPLDCFPKDRPLAQIIERRLHIMANELPYDAQRIKAWAFCMTVLSMSWTVEGHGKIDQHQTEVASAIDLIKV